MPNYVSMLLKSFEEHSLCDRHPELTTYQMLAQMGKLSQNVARGILIQIQDLIEHYKDFPCHLHRVPTRDQLYADGMPDVEVGSLDEDEQLRFGIKFLDRPRHILAAGATGSGKTTLFRTLIMEVNKLNEKRREQTHKPDNI
jgi:Cdc6-like AAA superfamily ATPase